MTRRGSIGVLDILLRLVVALEVLAYLSAALLHLGLQTPLGSMVLLVNGRVPAASIVETILGLAVAANFAWLMRRNPRWKSITIGVHLFALVGVSLGMVALAIRVGPPPGPHWTLHYVMLTGIAAVMAMVIPRRVSVNRSKPADTVKPESFPGGGSTW